MSVGARTLAPIDRPAPTASGAGRFSALWRTFDVTMLANGTMKHMHPFDMIGFDGDGACTPDIDDETAERFRSTWQAINATPLPTIAPR